VQTEIAPTPRQEEILDHTFELVREAGLAGLTMKKVAERVGFTEAAVYRHFPSKQALLLGLVGRLEEMLLGTVRTIARDPSLPAPAKLEAILVHHIGLLVATDGLPILLIAEASASGDEEIIARIAAVLRQHLGLLAEVLRTIPSAAGLPPSERSALLFLGLPAALALERRVLGAEAADAAAIAELVPFFVRRLTGGAGDRP
jgi:AcrR family transcriptional regulator